MIKSKFSFAGLALLLALVAAPAIANAEYWVLKPERTISTDEEDYTESMDDPCEEQLQFCGFTAPETFPGSGIPDINAVPNLQSDLASLAANPSSQANSSGAVHFEGTPN